MKPAQFEYHAPSTAKEAVDLLAELGDGAKVIAGGQSLVPVLAMRLAIFDHLIDIGRIDALRGIEDSISTSGAPVGESISTSGAPVGESISTSGAPVGESIWIGAGTTEAEIGKSGLIRAKVPLLSRATPLIGHFQIRNRGTIGGSLAHAEASAEYPAVLLALEGVIEALSPRGERTIAASEFFTGIWSTALEPDELLTGVRFPAARGRQGFAIEEFARRAGDFAVAGAAVAVELAAGGAIARASISLFGLGPTPLRAVSAETLAVGAGEAPASVSAETIGRAAVTDLDSVPADLHGTADYRRKVGAVMVARAWDKAVKEAANG